MSPEPTRDDGSARRLLEIFSSGRLPGDARGSLDDHKSS